VKALAPLGDTPATRWLAGASDALFARVDAVHSLR
jgi:hypothetical protein